MPDLIRRASSHCGGHLTWLFTVESDDSNPVWQGSRGAGICIEAGLNIHCTASKASSDDIEITVENANGDSNIDLNILYSEVVKTTSLFTNVTGIHWHFHVDTELPISQGFGLSAAGALAAARCVLAISVANSSSIELERAALSIAHLVERRLSGGLGDVLGLAAGGVERRSVPGAPFHFVDNEAPESSNNNLENITPGVSKDVPHKVPIHLSSIVSGPGDSEGFETHIPVILCWNAEAEHHTSKYIDNAEWQVRIRNAGADCMDTIGVGGWSDQRWPELLTQSHRFANDSGLAIDSDRSELLRQTEQVITSFAAPATALLCMLGESVSIVPTALEGDHSWAEPLNLALKKAGLNTVLTQVENRNSID
jgi:pantoate kinase